jgi:hypothetical protein
MQYLLNAGMQRQGTAAYEALCDKSASAVGIVLEWLMFAFENTLLEEIGLASSKVISMKLAGGS